MTRKLILAITLVLTLSIPAQILSDEPYPDTNQAVVRLLAGCRGTDWHDSTFAGRDSVSWAFKFYNPADDDTLDLAPSAVLIWTDATVCSIYTYGHANDFIDEARPMLLYANESLLLPAKARWIHLQVPAGGGTVRSWAFAD